MKTRIRIVFVMVVVALFTPAVWAVEKSYFPAGLVGWASRVDIGNGEVWFLSATITNETSDAGTVTIRPFANGRNPLSLIAQHWVGSGFKIERGEKVTITLTPGETVRLDYRGQWVPDGLNDFWIEVEAPDGFVVTYLLQLRMVTGYLNPDSGMLAAVLDSLAFKSEVPAASVSISAESTTAAETGIALVNVGSDPEVVEAEIRNRMAAKPVRATFNIGPGDKVTKTLSQIFRRSADSFGNLLTEGRVVFRTQSGRATLVGAAVRMDLPTLPGGRGIMTAIP